MQIVGQDTVAVEKIKPEILFLYKFLFQWIQNLYIFEFLKKFVESLQGDLK